MISVWGVNIVRLMRKLLLSEEVHVGFFFGTFAVKLVNREMERK